MERQIYSTAKVPQSSYFYDKLLRHEEIHVEQFESGIASSYYTLDDLWQNHLQGLTNENEGILTIAIRNVITAFVAAENERIKPLRAQLEEAAYRICDPIDPQYIFQKCGRFVVTPNAPNN